jgi:quercetin 2,3-dioxygenase
MKPIKQIIPQQLQPNKMGFTSVDMFHTEHHFEPFLVFTEFHMDRSVFGPHPHAGISVMTYMLPDSEGSFLNRDSMGDHSIIEPGGLHVTQAGSGVKHDEVPAVAGIDCHGFQIWINHAEGDRWVSPKAFHAAAKEIAEYRTPTVQVRVLQGKYKDAIAPFTLVTPVSLFDVTLQPHTTIELETAEMAFVYLMTGEVRIGEQMITGTATVSFEKTGNTISISTGERSANFMFASGTSHNEPIIHGGPFVMTTAEQMAATQQRLHRGEMGVLQPL